MRRGTRVGQAYVALTVDGDGMNDEIANSFDDVDFKEIGDEHGRAYRKALKDHLDGLDKDFNEMTDRIGNRLSSRLEKAVSTDSALDDHVSKTLANAFDNGKLDSLMKRVGEKAGVNFGTEFDHIVKKEVLDSLEGALQDAARSGGNGFDLSKILFGRNPSGGGQVEILGAAFDDAVKRVKIAQVKMTADAEKAEAERTRIVQMAEAKNASIAQMFAEKRISMHELSNREIVKSDERLVVDQQKIYDRLRKEEEKRDNDMWTVRRKSASAYGKYLKDLERGVIDKFGNAVSGNKNGIGDRIGKLFGAGSRNNALNVVGSLLGTIVGTVDKVARGAGKMGTAFVEGFSEADDAANFFQKTLKGFEGAGAAGIESVAGGFEALVASAPGAAVAIGVVTVALSALVSVISALTGLAVALAATVASALVGAVLVLGGAFVAAAAAGGLLVAAFSSMTDAQRSLLSKAFHPLKAELTGIGQIVIKDLVPHFQTWSKNLQEALLQVAPLASVMGEAFGKAGDIITKSLSGKGFQNLFASLTANLPAITTNLSKAFGNLLNGFAGVFAAVMPLVTQFSDYLKHVTGDFAKWANSAKGQNSIKDFADRAVDSLKSLWGAIKEVGGFFKDLLFNKDSQDAGNSMFDSLRDSFKRFRDAIDKASKDGSLKQWFDDAIEFGGDLKDVVVALKDAWKKLYNSGVLQATGDLLKLVADQIDNVSTMLSPLIKAVGWAAPRAFDLFQASMDAFTGSGIIGVLGTIGGAVNTLIGAFDRLIGRQNDASNYKVPGAGGADGLTLLTNPGQNYPKPHKAPRTQGSVDKVRQAMGRTPAGSGSSGTGHHSGYTIDGLIAAGEAALSQTDTKHGGTASSGGSGSGSDAAKKAKDKWKNPYIKFANSLIYEGPALSKILSKAIGKARKQINDAITKANNADDLSGARSVLSSTISTLKESAKSSVDAAHSALNSAAQDLKSASGPKEAAKALKEVHKAQKDLAKALQNQKKLQALAASLESQKTVHTSVTDKIKELLTGKTGDAVTASDFLAVRLILNRQNTTLADFAKAREIVAAKLSSAKDKLADALSLRDDFEKSVSDAAKSFGALTTAQAQTINGVEQALNAGDIVGNLQDRLAKIQHFQEGLRILLAQGLSDAAYKQIVEAGVEDGSSYVDALIQGGSGAIDQVNGLTSQIGSISDKLGTETASRLYQAGVDAAQGLVDGLESLSDELDAAATRLGHQIAAAIKKELGIHSPSTVMFDAMDYGVGDGLVKGLDAQHAKVGNAATRLSDKISVSPEVAAYAASQRQSAVSGNSDDKKFELTVITPTKDPKAVAMETMNEITGRL